MVLRRSTTRCTCPSDLRSAARSTVIFMSDPARCAETPGVRCGARGSKVAVGSLSAREESPYARPCAWASTVFLASRPQAGWRAFAAGVKSFFLKGACGPQAGHRRAKRPPFGRLCRPWRRRPAHQRRSLLQQNPFHQLDSSASTVSLSDQASILLHRISTVVWSRPPKRAGPISGSERSVQRLGQDIAIWRWCAHVLAVRRDDRRSRAADIVLARRNALDVLILTRWVLAGGGGGIERAPRVRPSP